jgi:DNA (cytosine-5)-methyltransferase 1
MRKPAVIDLFSGVGGLTLGAARAGFNVACAVELDSKAAGTHSLNFPKCRHLEEDVQKLRGPELLSKSGLKKGELIGLIGGPPCQGFSAIGLKAATDPRNGLLGDFFRLVAETLPCFFLAENVPGVLDIRNRRVLDSALAGIPRRYTVLKPFTVKASDFGAPTVRTRVFFIGFDSSYVDSLSEKDFAAKDVTDVRVRDALANLPGLRSTWLSESQSWRAVGELDPSEYADAITNRIPSGVGCEPALARYRERREVSGFLGTKHEAATIKRFAALRPGEADAVSKCMRLDPNGYCPTLRAGTGPERGSFQAIRPVHPHSPRVISPREAARLQGFPDWFQFHPTKWHAFRQIGNSVSPIIAEHLLRKLKKAAC